MATNVALNAIKRRNRFAWLPWRAAGERASPEPDLAEAALGAKVDIPTPKGIVTLKIPPCTSGGAKLRVKSHGVVTKDGPGDLIAEVQIIMPKKLDDAARSVFERLAQQGGENPRVKLQW